MKIIFKAIIVYTIIFTSSPLFAQKNNKAETQKKVCQTKPDSTDFEIFKENVEKKLSDNQNKIALLKAKKPNVNIKSNKKFSKKITALEKKNNELKKRINKCIKLSLWSSFKSKFIRDMKKLGEALDDMAVDQYELSQ